MKEIKRLTRCERGHFYDAGKFDVCPHCEQTREASVTKFGTQWRIDADNAQDVQTMFSPESGAMPGRSVPQQEDVRSSREVSREIPREAPREVSREVSRDISREAAVQSVFAAPQAVSSRQDDSLTVQFYQKTLGTEPVVGWLVCVQGVHCGQDFRIKSGRNFVGRSGSMDICLSGDMAVSRDRHMIVTYDPRSGAFFAQPGDTSSALSYLNDKPLLEATALKTGDKLTVGESDLLFVSFCGTIHKWNK